jgi:hypothetical protein
MLRTNPYSLGMKKVTFGAFAAAAIVGSVAGCGGSGAASQASVSAMTGASSQTPSGSQNAVTRSGALPDSGMQLQSIEMTEGEALRVILNPTGGVPMSIGVFGKPLEGDRGDSTSPAGIYRRAMGTAVSAANDASGYVDLGGYADTWSGKYGHADPVSSSKPTGTALLAEDWAFRGGCQDGQVKWLVFVAPTAGTYQLGVFSIVGRDGDSSSLPTFDVTYQTAQSPSVTASAQFGDQSSGIGAGYAAQVRADVPFFTDSKFFPAARFNYGQRPFDQKSCGADGSWQPVPIPPGG